MALQSIESSSTGEKGGFRIDEEKVTFSHAAPVPTDAGSRVDNNEVSAPLSFADDDPDNPKKLSAAQRWLIVVAASLMVSLSVFAPAVIVPAAPQVLETFHVSDDVYRTLIVTIWDLGEAISPFLAGPLSETFGRAPIYHGGNILGLLTVLITSFSTNISMFSAFRFLSGLFLTSPILAPAIIGDVIRPSERGVALSVSQGFRIMSPFLAPIMGAYINSALGWRWILWILSSIIAAVAAFNLTVVRETYTPKILERKALRSSDHARVAFGHYSAHRTQVLRRKIIDGSLRPIKLVFGSHLILTMALYQGIVGGMQSLMATTLTEIMEKEYNIDRGSVGLTFIGPSIGLLLGTLFYGFTSDRYLKHKAEKHGGVVQPRHRLAHTLLGSFMLPLGLLFYGWTLNYHLPFVVPLIGTSIIGFSFLLTILPIANYLVDAFELHSASAIAGCTVLYLITAAIFPLSGPALFRKLGYGWGNSLLALICALFIPFLLILIFLRPYKAK